MKKYPPKKNGMVVFSILPFFPSLPFFFLSSEGSEKEEKLIPSVENKLFGLVFPFCSNF